MMTRKDFKAVAKEIAAMKDRKEAKKWAETMAKIFANQNPKFSYSIFYTACNI